MVVNFTSSSVKTHINSKQNNKQDGQTFKGLGDVIAAAMVASDKSPMIGVSIIDLSSMIIPRTVIDATRNGFAATETFLRESAGLIINCLIPSFIVLGVAKLLQKKSMGEYAKYQPAKILANAQSNNLLTNSWIASLQDGKANVRGYVGNVLKQIEALSGSQWKSVKDLQPEKYALIEGSLATAIKNNDKKRLDRVANILIKRLGASRSLRLNDKTPLENLNVKNLFRDMNDMGQVFIKEVNPENVKNFSKKLNKYVNIKSLGGLAVVIGLGASFQYFNRMLTKYRTGTDDFVGEADYMKNRKNNNNNTKASADKSKLNLHKMLGALWMGSLALFSFGKIPTLGMFQFNGMFPTMNQCRAISAMTYTGRILSATSDNELKESAFRDTCTFINLYYLGNYVSKGVATLMEKFGGKNLKGALLNQTKEAPKSKNIFTQFKHWFKNTELKSFDELGKAKGLKKYRALAEASGILYSCVVLGIFVPMYNKYRTNKNAENNRKEVAQRYNNLTVMDQNKYLTLQEVSAR